TLEYISTHVFMPLRLPCGDDHSVDNDHALAEAVCAALRAYEQHASAANQPQWSSVSKMLSNLSATVRYHPLEQRQVISQMAAMKLGDVVAYLIRAQNAAVIFRKQEERTVFESFEVSPMADAVMGARGRLVCSYPGPAITTPNDVFDDAKFRSELANFLVHMNEDVIDDAVATTTKAGSTVTEERDTTHPRYITELLTGILRAVGRPADVQRITKRIGDDVVWNDSRLPWRRSSLWLLIRVALQTTLEQSTLGRERYKAFMLFFMHQLTQKALEKDMSSELLHFMSAKLSRRLKKLGASAPEWLSQEILQTTKSVRQTLETRWDRVIQAQAASPHWAPLELSLSEDTKLSLVKSREYLHAALENQTTSSSSSEFNPQHHRRGTLDEFLSVDGKFFEGVYRAEPYLTLYDFERAVAHGIDVWVAGITEEGADRACEKLELSANKYSSNARKMYKNNPEDLSLMLLTLLELWVALDKIVVKKIPILKDYSPEVPTTLLERFLLRKHKDFERLRLLYEYIRNRHSRAHRGWSVFSDRADGNSFRIRYYNNSSSMQSLKHRIEQAARSERERRVDELEQKNARHMELAGLVERGSHTFYVDLWGNSIHDRSCVKCARENEMSRMEIEVHEWPLPSDELYASIVVFELQCPIAFDLWRSATFHLLVDVCSPLPERKNPYIVLGNYSDLQPHCRKHRRARVTFASDAKPFIGAHYRSTRIPSTEDKVCVNNGLQFYGFDSIAGVPVAGAFKRVDVSHQCTYQLQDGPYRNLQCYIGNTSHTTNSVLVNQADCHHELSIHEFIAFGSLRSGCMVQWLNILRELRDRALSFRRHEIQYLLVQATCQVGPLSIAGEWVWHHELRGPHFCMSLLGELESLVLDVEANWLESVTMNTISFLATRVLASSPDSEVSHRVYRLLRSVRKKTHSWVQELSKKVEDADGEVENEELRWRLRDAGAICRSTFDVDPEHYEKILNSPEDVEILVCCAILVHDNTPAKLDSIPETSKLLLERDRRLSWALENVLSNLIQNNDEGLHYAVSRMWPSYQRGSLWEEATYPNSRWFSCWTASQKSQQVSFNLLDGTLLVDGKPSGKLPLDVMRHPLYQLVFGNQRILDVIPGSTPGMEFSTRELISHCWQVHFAMKGNKLTIKAQAQGKDHVLELIPQEELRTDLPEPLVMDHVHWLNPSTRKLEVRPLSNQWESSVYNWEIHLVPGAYSAQKCSLRLVDIRSRTWKMISDRLKPLECSHNLLVTLAPDGQVSVDVPRYGLSFFIGQDGELYSRNLRGMVYDANQSTGTMIGLINKLVLRPNVQLAEEHSPRCVLIPEGKVSVTSDGDHSAVRINSDTLPRVTYQTYKIDTTMGCMESLTGNVSLTNKLFQAYLHAVTSSPYGTDPLTKKTGTEEALEILRSASCRSFMKIGSRDAELLCLIGSLAPGRVWYPAHLAKMQKVGWTCLPAAAHHHGFYLAAKSIKEICDRFRPFEGNQAISLERFPAHEAHLLDRAALRAAHLHPSEFAGPLPSEDCDRVYNSRDIVCSSPGEHRAHSIACAVRDWSSGQETHQNMFQLLKSLGSTLAGYNPDLSLQYNNGWLSPNLLHTWIPIYRLCRRGDSRQRFELLFSLAAMAYGSPQLENPIPTLLAFATVPEFKTLSDPPPYEDYDLSRGSRPSWDILWQCVSVCAYGFENSPESRESAIPRQIHESISEWRHRQRLAYEKRLNEDVSSAVATLHNSWPRDTPPSLSLNHSSYDVSKLTSSLAQLFSSCYRNMKLEEYLARVQELLDESRASHAPLARYGYTFERSSRVPLRSDSKVTLQELLTLRAPPDPLPRADRTLPTVGHLKKSLGHSGKLSHLISELQSISRNVFQCKYAEDLARSEVHLKEDKSSTGGAELLPCSIIELARHYQQSRRRFQKHLKALESSLAPQSSSDNAIYNSGQWPRITVKRLLSCIASKFSITLPSVWRTSLSSLACLGLELQRSGRLLSLAAKNHFEEFYKELENEGCNGWNAEENPDWLLIQASLFSSLEGDFLIRPIQVNVAAEMISPQSGHNTAQQLNMGEGKSSVIVPIAVATLADGDKLVRVVVPKALMTQMFQLLVDRLGGLTDRRVYCLPFSRSVNVGPVQAQVLHDIMQECMCERGILVVQPDHILSLKLMSVEKQFNGADKVASMLLESQRWLHSYARDVLDESDEILHVRYQLVYTIGLQTHLEGFPERWTTTQQVLGVVKKNAVFLREKFPHGIELEDGPLAPGAFPSIRILHPDAGRELISRVTKDVMDGLLFNFSFEKLSSRLRKAIKAFISVTDVGLPDIQMVKDHSQGDNLWRGLLLLRGLLASGIIQFALKERRWRVDYGLAPSRTMLAVPYRAKDVPSLRAEFGHPDIAIVLTCLSYYYQGLTKTQLMTAFQLLLKEDNPALEYETWIRGCPSIPDTLQRVSGVNLQSPEQWRDHLFPLFGRNQAAVDFYLCQVVFPKEAKEFPSKLSCSGWDLAETRKHLTTGFSGTNDGQYLLPTSITQRDPDHQRSTNAKVLAYLLQPENNYYKPSASDNGERRTAHQFLELLTEQEPEIRVLLDVGAQVLELQNSDVAIAWLGLKPDARAAIYFNEDDELMVRARDGTIQPLSSSPFAQQLDECVVYLDDAHTRGTNIKFPTGFRAAVTLGPKVTKDRLTQGCMRMRKLGHGHSVMFFAPREVDQSIRAAASKSQSDSIDVVDILRWTILETCDEIQQRAPQWAQHGVDHNSRYEAWAKFCREEISSETLTEVWCQPEAKSLEELYAPDSPRKSFVLTVPEIRQRCSDLGIRSLSRAGMDEEQEREVIHEVERERQVQRPPKTPAAKHQIHPDVELLVQSGIVVHGSTAFRPVFDSLANTSAAFAESHVWTRSILATTDFCNTIVASRGSEVDDYLRPVNWVLSTRVGWKQTLVILSPHEVNELLPKIRSSKHVHLHIYTPRTTEAMKPCDDLNFYNIPAVPANWSADLALTEPLNVFAGQLYLGSYDLYIQLCRFLCIYAKDLGEEGDFVINNDGFIVPEQRPLRARRDDSFMHTPMPALKALISLRRKGMRFGPTHMGRILNGRLLREEDF
ncbi:hypothetical protein F5I97DRAFT_1984211, partial [Phlebopus sp. FC_14]